MAWSKLNGKGLLLPILSGVLLGTSYTPFPPWALLFAFLPLWSLWLKKDLSWKRLFFYRLDYSIYFFFYCKILGGLHHP